MWILIEKAETRPTVSEDDVLYRVYTGEKADVLKSYDPQHSGCFQLFRATEYGIEVVHKIKAGKPKQSDPVA